MLLVNLLLIWLRYFFFSGHRNCLVLSLKSSIRQCKAEKNVFINNIISLNVHIIAPLNVSGGKQTTRQDEFLTRLKRRHVHSYIEVYIYCICIYYNPCEFFPTLFSSFQLLYAILQSESRTWCGWIQESARKTNNLMCQGAGNAH